MQTFVNVPHDGRVVDGAGHHEVSISRPADVIDVAYVSPEDRKKKSKTEQQKNKCTPTFTVFHKSVWGC